MFGTFFSWLRRERNRQIFAYWDGRKVRRIDPMVAMEGLDQDPEFVFEKHVPAADRGDHEAIRVVVAAVSRTFGVREYSENQPGLTRAECFDLLSSFLDYCDALKKNTAAPATSSSPTDSGSLATSITNAESVFG